MTNEEVIEHIERQVSSETWIAVRANAIRKGVNRFGENGCRLFEDLQSLLFDQALVRNRTDLNYETSLFFEVSSKNGRDNWHELVELAKRDEGFISHEIRFSLVLPFFVIRTWRQTFQVGSDKYRRKTALGPISNDAIADRLELLAVECGFEAADDSLLTHLLPQIELELTEKTHVSVFHVLFADIDGPYAGHVLGRKL